MKDSTKNMAIDSVVGAIVAVIVAALCIGFCFFLTGCDSILQALSGFATDPSASGAAERGVEGAAGIASFFGPIGGLIAGGLSTGLLIWRKVKPTLVAAKTKAEQYHAAAAATVTALESFKKASPDQWDALGKLIEDQLKEQGINPLIVENVIRGLRGLPAKPPSAGGISHHQA